MLKILIFSFIVLLCINAQILQPIHKEPINLKSILLDVPVDCECTPINLCASTKVVNTTDSR